MRGNDFEEDSCKNNTIGDCIELRDILETLITTLLQIEIEIGEPCQSPCPYTKLITHNPHLDTLKIEMKRI